MRWAWLLVVVAACGSDGLAEGARGACAEGGALNQCPVREPTAEGACWHLVDCAVIPVQNDNAFDWGNCVNKIETLTADRQELVIDCIETSTCDALDVNGSPDQPDGNSIVCFRIGDQQ